MAKRPTDQYAVFPTTDWSLVGHAGGESDNRRREALNRLLARYRPALVAHLVFAKQIPPHDADDLVQGFVENKILYRNLVGAADRGRGRFRRLLVTALENYVANELRRDSAKKRAADHARPVDPLVQDRWSAADVPPDQAFDFEWARQLLNDVARRMQERCTNSQRESLWGVFEARILGPIIDGKEPPGYDQLVRQFRFRSPSEASNALITAKRMYARLLREAIAEYIPEADIDAEIQDLERILSG